MGVGHTPGDSQYGHTLAGFNTDINRHIYMGDLVTIYTFICSQMLDYKVNDKVDNNT